MYQKYLAALSVMVALMLFVPNAGADKFGVLLLLNRDGDIFSVDPITGAAKLVGDTGFENCSALDFDPMGNGSMTAVCETIPPTNQGCSSDGPFAAVIDSRTVNSLSDWEVRPEFIVPCGTHNGINDISLSADFAFMANIPTSDGKVRIFNMRDTFWHDTGGNCCAQGAGIAFSPTNDLIIVDSGILKGIAGKIAAADFDETSNIIYALVTEEGFDPVLVKISSDGKTVIAGPIPITTEMGKSNRYMQGIAWQVQPTLPLPTQKLNKMADFRVQDRPRTTAFKPLSKLKPNDFGCPNTSKGLFHIITRLKNESDKTLSDLVVEVDTLKHNLLIEARGPRENKDLKGAGTVGEGGYWVLPKKLRPNYGDGKLTPKEEFDIFHFFLCLESFEKFKFEVNLWGNAE